MLFKKYKNNILGKLIRTITSLLPIAKNRKWNCINCGECCKLPSVCPFLKYNEKWKSYCSVYAFRPLVCRKYPRIKKEWITQKTCGYFFEENK